MDSTLNAAIIGFGAAGKIFHAPLLKGSRVIQLASVQSSNPNSKEWLNEHFPNAIVVDDLQKVLDDEHINIVIITTPNHTHFPIAKRALEAGKHVVVDKPFTISSKEAEHLIALAKSQQKVLTVYQNRRLDSDFKTVQSLVRQQTLGAILETTIHFDRYRPQVKTGTWRESNTDGAGIFYDLGPHLIDQALQLFGTPDSLYAHIGTQRAATAPDFFELQLYYKATKVILKAGMMVRETGPHYMLHGTKGSFVKYGMDVQEAALKAGKFPAEEAKWGIEPETIHGFLHTELNGHVFRGHIESKTGDYREFYQNLYEAISKQAALIVKPEEAAEVIYIIEKAIESNTLGKRIDII